MKNSVSNEIPKSHARIMLVSVPLVVVGAICSLISLAWGIAQFSQNNALGYLGLIAGILPSVIYIPYLLFVRKQWKIYKTPKLVPNGMISIDQLQKARRYVYLYGGIKYTVSYIRQEDQYFVFKFTPGQGVKKEKIWLVEEKVLALIFPV